MRNAPPRPRALLPALLLLAAPAAAENGTGQNGTALIGTAPNGTAPNGTAPNGTAPNDTAPNDTAPNDTAPNETARNGTTPATAPEAGVGAPAPYSLPWQLRPVAAITVIRSDTAFAFYENTADQGGNTLATMLLASYRIGDFSPLVRVGYVGNWPPVGDSGSAFLNPVVGATWFRKLTGDLRFAAFLGLTIPVGGGGGNTPDPEDAAALRSGIVTRSAMDNAMFAVNDFTVFPGVGLAWVRSRFTAQLEATVLQLTRVRGEDVQADESRTNFTTGLHVGWFAVPQLSLGGEIRMQRWLSTPANVKADSKNRDTFTFAVGPRLHLQPRKGLWIRPGLAYVQGLDAPMTTSNYRIIQLDVPVAF